MRKPPNREQYSSTGNTGSKRRETACGRECSKWTSPVAGTDRIIVEPESFGCLVSAALALPLPIEKDNLGGPGGQLCGVEPQHKRSHAKRIGTPPECHVLGRASPASPI